ncbi:hypothetical protein [Vibrio rhodolitus]|uniref:hypothetical protein n=1 Tax=Vibrio rhodolitus TaxID=2231649 RepID=UPI000E0C0795|nr:hypothetical protein [Vibrio rhodolitus]
MFRKIGLVSAVCACLTAPAVASYQLEHLQPLDSQELSSYRGGFLGDDFMINIGLDIATSINGETLFNNRIANLFFQNGRLVATQPEVVPTTTIVQIGAGNSVALPTIEPISVTTPAPTSPVESPPAPSTPVIANRQPVVSDPDVVNPPAVPTTSTVPTTPTVAQTPPPNPPQIDPNVVTSATQINISQSVVLPSVTQNTINRIIQNSLDGTVIDFQTVVNIDAQVEGVLRRMDRENRIRQSLQLNFN